MTVEPGVTALNYAALRTAADLADHWIQTDRQARVKGTNGGDGRKACAAHVASYTATQAVALMAASRASGIRLNGRALTAALALSAVTHYVADRRTPLKRLADLTGKGVFVRLADHGMNGAYCLDQAWHHTFEAVAAVVGAVGARTR